MFCIHCGNKVHDNAQCRCGFAAPPVSGTPCKRPPALAIGLKIVSLLIISASAALLFGSAIEASEQPTQKVVAQSLRPARLHSTADSAAMGRGARVSSHSKQEPHRAAEGEDPRNEQTVLPGPRITAPIHILAQARQAISIAGSGFGNQNPYNGNSRFIRITDLTTNWNAGNSDDGAFVTLDVTEWNDSQIKILGFTGWYGGQWHLNVGDDVRVQIWNPQTGAGPATVTVRVQPGEIRGKEATETQ